jgi:hypothetical protein
MVVMGMGACATVKNYDKQGQDIGFEHYAASYYLVVHSTKDNGTDVSVLTLPNLSKPEHLKYRAGMGKLEFSYKVTNGVLTEFGEKTESAATEAITGVAALATAYGAVLAGAAKTSALEERLPVPQGPIFFSDLTSVAKELENVVKVLNGASSNDVCKKVSENVTRQMKLLTEAATLKQSDIANITEVITQRQQRVRKISEELQSDQRVLDQYAEQLSDKDMRAKVVIASLAIKKQIPRLDRFGFPAGQLEIYEICDREPGGGIEFRPVALNDGRDHKDGE